MEDSIITELGLNNEQVRLIVLEWYTCGMFADILQNEYGLDLEEILEQ